MRPVFNIRPVNRQPAREIRYRLYQQTHLEHWEGLLYDWAFRWELIHFPERRTIQNPAMLTFAADHGMVYHFDQRPAVYDTSLAILDFLNDRSAFSAMARSERIRVRWIDAGLNTAFDKNVDFWIHREDQFLDRKMGYGSFDPMIKPSMTTFQLGEAMDKGSEVVSSLYAKGSNTVILGSAGEGGFLGSLLIRAAIEQMKPSELIDELGIKWHDDLSKLMDRVTNKHPKTTDPFMILNLFGGFDLAMLTGAILQAADLRMAIIPGDLQALTALEIALKWYPSISDYVFHGVDPIDPVAARITRGLKVKGGIPDNRLPFGYSGVSGLSWLRMAAGIGK
ncbi:MAG: nicotinate-nucleotide--dimethylbenzimidazole phosphoribosyltransferase [Bacteroidota bacterium]|nr:nicotinate-nucleotide--dimethylbenzimidazole phosphoribosyltransferase [Bacteroidota bacterium]